MRLAVKFFLVFSLVILVLAGIAAWSLYEVGKLTIADRTITVRAAEALRSAAYLREAVSTAKRVDMRSLVFGDKEYTDASSAGATNITQEFDRLAALLTTEQEQTLIRAAATGFKDYYATVTETRELRKRGDLKRAEKLMQDEAQPGVDRVVENLDRLVKITRDNLDQTQTEATAALGQARREIEGLRTRTWEAVTAAMLLAVVAALAGTGIISFRMTRSLGRLSDATKALAEGSFHEPLPVDTKDEIGALAKSFNTMAARLRETDEMKEKFYSEMQDAKAVAEKANLAKSDFLSSMSHELRTPLNAILGFAELMESDSPLPTPAQKESIAQILQAGWHLLKLINEILDLAKVESRQVPLSKEPVSLAEVMLGCQSMVEPQAQQRGLRMTFPQFDIPCFVLADRTRLKQVLINLLSNAIKYNIKQGSVEVKCTESTPPGRIHVSIRDTGAGLSPGQLTQLFQPFNRLGQEAGGEEGTGIGLVVAKRLVELMGGVIGVESTVGVGSVFWFELIAVAEPHVSTDGGDAVELTHLHMHRGAQLHTLLYVEDNPASLQLVEKIIARHPDMRLLTAVNGNSGIEIARASQPDVILMDINLPGINGFEAQKILRSDPATAHIPIIAVSANAMPLDVERGLKAGFFRYITKPIKVNEFMEALDVALAVSETGSANKK
jgi:signal transduction histidine kinase/ActR/RegA family two-component response regulator